MKKILFSDFFSNEEINRLFNRAFKAGQTCDDREAFFSKIENAIEFYVNKYSKMVCSRFDREDLKMEAWTIVLNELPNYDQNKGEITTFLRSPLNYGLLHYVTKGRFILSVSDDDEKLICRIQKLRKEFMDEYDHEPAAEDLAAFSGMKLDKVIYALGAEMAVSGNISLNAPIDEDQTELCELIPDNNCCIDAVFNKYSRDQLLSLIDITLDYREAKAVKCYFGFNDYYDDCKKTYDSLKVIINVKSKQLAGHILKEALEKLRVAAKCSPGCLAA